MDTLSSLEKLVLRLRPAPLASSVADFTGLSKRRFVTNSGASFYVNPISEFGLALRRGDHEPEMKAVLERLLKPGSVFIDLGANEGYFSVIASQIVGPKGRVIAVEPQRRLQTVLQANFEANNCRNIEVLRVAVCASSGTVQMQMTSERNTGSTSLYRTTKYPQKEEEVAGLTLSELLKQAETDRCDLMKVDIEGAEYDALTGGKDVLETGAISNIVLEYHDSILERRGVSRRQLHEWILSRGYGTSELADPTVYQYRGR
jgi:FkbM family methyltransferase